MQLNDDWHSDDNAPTINIGPIGLEPRARSVVPMTRRTLIFALAIAFVLAVGGGTMFMMKYQRQVESERIATVAVQQKQALESSKRKATELIDKIKASSVADQIDLSVLAEAMSGEDAAAIDTATDNLRKQFEQIDHKKMETNQQQKEVQEEDTKEPNETTNTNVEATNDAANDEHQDLTTPPQTVDQATPSPPQYYYVQQPQVTLQPHRPSWNVPEHSTQRLPQQDSSL